MERESIIHVENIYKSFQIPHERITTIRGAFVNILRRKTFETFRALENVSFDIKKGEFFGIIGRNGSGKSTLLKILAGIYLPDEGLIDIKERVSPFLELGIAFSPELSGRDNVYLNATVLGLTRKEIDKKFDAIVSFSGLERFIDQKIKNYSSGMKVRLAFSVDIHSNRDILLMDEVLAVGDISFQEKCLSVFRRLKKEGKTIVLVSHSIKHLHQFSDRIMLLDSGKIREIGKPTEMLKQYINLVLEDGTEEGKKNAKKISRALQNDTCE